MPQITTLHYVFTRLNVVALETELQTGAAHTLPALPAQDPLQGLDPPAEPPPDEQFVLDGKALRGIHGEELPGVRLVALYATQAGLVLAQAGGPDPRGTG
jgi:hypothetical protein